MAAALKRFVNDQPGRAVEIGCMVSDRGCHRATADMFIDAVGREQKDVGFFDRDRPIVDFDLRIDSQRAAEIGLLRGNDDTVIVGQLFERVAGKPVNAAIAGMKNVCRGRFDDQRAQGADVALVLVVSVLASPCLGVQPDVGCGQHALGRCLHRPGLGRAVVVGQKAFDCRLAGNMADVTAADAVGDHHRNAFQVQQWFAWDQRAVKILVGRLAAFVRTLP